MCYIHYMGQKKRRKPLVWGSLLFASTKIINFSREMQIALTFRNVLRNVKRRVLHTLGLWMCYITRRAFLWLENSLGLPLWKLLRIPQKSFPFHKIRSKVVASKKFFVSLWFNFMEGIFRKISLWCVFGYRAVGSCFS